MTNSLKRTAAAAAFVLAMAGSYAAMAQSVLPSAVAGKWLYDGAGNTIGSVVGPADSGNAAEIMIGNYLQPGSHQALVPAGSLYIVDGRVTLQAQSLQALNLPPRK